MNQNVQTSQSFEFNASSNTVNPIVRASEGNPSVGAADDIVRLGLPHTEPVAPMGTLLSRAL